MVALAGQRAHAAPIFEGVNYDIVISIVAPVGTNDLLAITFSAIGKNGAIPSVFDSTNSGQGGSGITTIGNALHQIWEGGFAKTPTNDLNEPGSIPQQLDTHFLVDQSSAFFAILPNENRPVVDPTEHPFAGYGSYLTGTFALTAPSLSSWMFLYVVVPEGAVLSFDFEIGAAGFSSEHVTAMLDTTLPPGDVNRDGMVNVFDVGIVSDFWDTSGPTGDANMDNWVDIFDVGVISDHWGQMLGNSQLSTPEPSTWILAAIGVSLAVARLGAQRLSRQT
jgi:hypothetical protein